VTQALQQSVAKPRIGVVVFPGSNDDRDAAEALGGLGAEPVLVWHGDEELPDLDAVVLPGGFSYGDYLRAGAIARFSPAMRAVSGFAAEGGLVLGICNGFQVLCEAGLLPGALRPNTSLAFVCRDVSRLRDALAVYPGLSAALGL
jgi:phosphoribosylformylglycinamidine synthase I